PPKTIMRPDTGSYARLCSTICGAALVVGTRYQAGPGPPGRLSGSSSTQSCELTAPPQLSSRPPNTTKRLLALSYSERTYCRGLGSPPAPTFGDSCRHWGAPVSRPFALLSTQTSLTAPPQKLIAVSPA